MEIIVCSTSIWLEKLNMSYKKKTQAIDTITIEVYMYLTERTCNWKGSRHLLLLSINVERRFDHVRHCDYMTG